MSSVFPILLIALRHYQLHLQLLERGICGNFYEEFMKISQIPRGTPRSLFQLIHLQIQFVAHSSHFQSSSTSQSNMIGDQRAKIENTPNTGPCDFEILRYVGK